MYLTHVLEEGSAQGGIGWMVWIALAIFFLMVFLGWWVSNKGLLKKEEEPRAVEHGDHAAHAQHVEQVERVQHIEPAVIAQKSAVDDLTILEGIGPKVARVLAGMGITTFADLALADYAKIKAGLYAAGYKYMDPAGWIEQAALAAKGDMEGLKKLQDSLKGGRKVA